VALRGDPPAGATSFTPHPDGFADSCALITALAETGRFAIRVGAYPDVHPEARDMAADIDWLKRKFDAGATEALTQFFFEADTFFRFRDACAAAGLDGDAITPGILPIESWKGTRRFAENCGTRIPAWMADAYAKAERDGRTELLSTALATELCDDLITGGVRQLHFYTLNRPELTRDVCHALGVQPDLQLQNVA
jgi:methylenetetrahydrofolate reductase (NADPH)